MMAILDGINFMKFWPLNIAWWNLIPYNDGLKTDKSSASTLLYGSVKSDWILKNKRIDIGISFIVYFNVDESVRIGISPTVNIILLDGLDYSTTTILKFV